MAVSRRTILCALAAPLFVTRPAEGAERLGRLVAAYPHHLARLDGQVVVWTDGTRMETGAGRPERPFEVMLRDATLTDQMRQAYPAGPPAGPPGRNHSPGRIRSTAFFVKMYGDCRRGGADRRHRTVTWMPQTRPQPLPVTTENDVATRLERVIAELERLPDRLKAYLVPSSGTFNCRTVADTGLLSMHAYAAAIDINVARSDYWSWARERGDIPYRNRIPFEIAEVFEAQRFIWGGKWYHYDTMHFEYRPELIGGA
ncbi:MAG: M15 family metallopeptidase [Phreatobacter sp.]|uniref:M15 family metallopeptidase n=1 Tax=Phreatobacter sp. TaxID=1966341 RepID=UPI002737354D|nr:M15 family metallopeptidase [Phreatobacter sp.]MDP2803251.1 M15 family metallopeptidase [Phreatobacter sp.]